MTGSNLDLNRVITKYIKNSSYCCYVRCPTLIVGVGGMPCSKTGATHYHSQLGLADNQRVGCLMGVTQPNTKGVWTEKEKFGSL